jgi:DNA-binding response OmpR family regulator
VRVTLDRLSRDSVPMRILVVEDEPTVANGVRRGLEADGFVVEIAGDGVTGLQRARSEHFDLIILDIMLPSMNGYRVCRALRTDEEWTPVLMLTAKSGEFDEAEGLELGADDFLTKPFSMVVLQARVRALLRRPQRRVDWPAIGGLRLDPLHHRCFRNDEVIELTAREMELLAYFLDRPGHVIGKTDILDAVWGPDFEGDRNIVEVYVSHLRRKLDEPFGRHTIETVRGRGYRLTVDEPI